MLLFLGSPRLARFLLKEKLVDELKLSVSPVTLGEGLHLFKDTQSNLILERSITMSNGVLGLTYKVS
ncbi:dihydrofolate reductase family protein [Streptococcus hyovaginalis]|uniref:dihydrofolate reductase family protein n=1 Tax=Streptococcus hyovaginalis TaxID=149015 RepID=UPI00248160B4|nr:dihydrofolate reductase family protein [Streptococcus hyovaginalis]